jgi:hypothetical protein
VRLQPSPDVLLGYRLGEIANLEGYIPHQAVDYQPGQAAGSKPMLSGGWESAAECLIARPAAGASSILELRCNAREVYLLAEAQQPARLSVTRNGVPADPVLVHELLLYRIVASDRLEALHLRLGTEHSGLQLYMLRFTTEAHRRSDAAREER